MTSTSLLLRRLLLVSGIPVLLGACETTVQLGSGQEETFDQFVQAFEAGNLQAMLALHADDAVVVPSGGGAMIVGKPAIEAYYRGLFNSTKSRRAFKLGYEWRTGADTATRISNAVIEIERAEGKSVLPIRATYVFRKAGPGWHLVTSHSSARSAPAPGEPPR